jgi:hypothetical protein
MWTSTLCPIGDATFHDPKCLMGNYEQCGIDQLITCLQEEDKRSQNLMSWKCYEKVNHGKTRVGLDNMILWLQYKETIVANFFTYLRPKFQKFIVHKLCSPMARWVIQGLFGVFPL